MRKSWLTSLFGIATGAAVLNAQGFNWKSALLAASLSALGVVSKDYNVTGSK